MTQHQFLNRRFQENNAAFMESLQNFAALLAAEKYWQQSQLIGLMIEILSETETMNARYITAIEKDIEKSLLLD